MRVTPEDAVGTLPPNSDYSLFNGILVAVRLCPLYYPLTLSLPLLPDGFILTLKSRMWHHD